MIHLQSDGQLVFVQKKDGESEMQIPVSVKRCFPWAEPTKYFSLRDRKDNEVFFIESLEDLSEKSRLAIFGALLEEGFCFKIEEILDIQEEFELRNWKVETEQGVRRFQTRLQDWPQIMSDGAVLVRDLSGDIYQIEDPKKLSDSSSKRLWAFME